MNANDNMFLNKFNFKFCSFIGYGPTGITFLAMNYKTKKNYVIKKISTKKFNSKLFDEARAKCPDVLPSVHKVVECGGYSYIIMEYFPNPLHKVFSIQAHLKADDQIKYAYKVIEALSQLHQINLYHGNIKPQNVLIDRYDQIHLADAGVSNTFADYDAHQEMRNQILFICPEIIKNSENGKKVDMFKADMWSLGVLLYYIATKFIPWSVRSKESYENQVLTNAPNYSKISDQRLVAVIRSCLQIDPDNRPTCEELLNLSIFADFKKEMAVKTKKFVTSSCPSCFVPLDSKIAHKKLNCILRQQATFFE